MRAEEGTKALTDSVPYDARTCPGMQRCESVLATRAPSLEQEPEGVKGRPGPIVDRKSVV